jgi:multiple sugar transport system ATP-binding protein
MASVKVEDVTVRFGQSRVLREVSFEASDGELCVLVGPSGCGKTTALRVVAGLTRPTTGHVYLDGKLSDGVSPGDRDVAMCFQTYALYPYMTVRQNWEFPLRAANLSPDEIESRVSSVMRMLHMEPLMGRLPRELSGGQQQRVAIGRALVRRPRLYLLDEPFGNLDAKLRVEMRAELKRLQMDLGITTLHVTHDQVEAQALGDRIVVMDVGTAQQVGTPEEIYEKPANLFVAGFIGTPRMNFIECSLERREGMVVALGGLFSLPLPPEMAARVEQRAPSGRITLGIRPESIKLSPVDDGGIPVQVYVTEPQGSELIADLVFGESLFKARIRRDRIGFVPKINDKVFASFAPHAVHVFDPSTGRRIN